MSIPIQSARLNDALLQQECCLLKFQADRLASSISIFLASPVSFDEAPKFLREQEKIMERFDRTEEFSQNLLFSLDNAIDALLDEHTETESRSP